MCYSRRPANAWHVRRNYLSNDCMFATLCPKISGTHFNPGEGPESKKARKPRYHCTYVDNACVVEVPSSSTYLLADAKLPLRLPTGDEQETNIENEAAEMRPPNVLLPRLARFALLDGPSLGPRPPASAAQRLVPLLILPSCQQVKVENTCDCMARSTMAGAKESAKENIQA